jgi:transposase
MIAVTQARGVGPGKAYLDRQQARGKDRVAAYRLLRRRLSDAVFTARRADAALTASTTASSATRTVPFAA